MAAPLRQYNIFSWTKFSAAPMLTICRGLDCVSVTVGVESYPESRESTKLGDTHLNCNWTDWRAFHKPPDQFTGTFDGFLQLKELKKIMSVKQYLSIVMAIKGVILISAHQFSLVLNSSTR